MAKTEPYPGTQAVRRAVLLLKTFSDDKPEWSLADLTAKTGLNKTTVYRVLSALEGAGLVTRSRGSDAYRLGPQVIALGAIAMRSNSLRRVAREELEGLVEELGETATLEVLVGREILIIDEVQGPSLLGARIEVGTTWPAHATSTGKVLLAAAEAGVYGGGADADPATDEPLRPATPHTIVSAKELREELRTVRERGFATAVEELQLGFVAVAAPIHDHENKVVAAIGVGGSRARLNARRIPEVARTVRGAASRISHQLGASERSLID